MANQSSETRREQVLHRLQRDHDWVDGPELANDQVGGSEGLKRVRELRMEGYRIEMRKHPDPARDIWQYRLVSDGGPGTVLPRGAPESRRRVDDRGVVQQPVTQIPAALPVAEPSGLKYSQMPTKLAFGEAVTCPGCEGRKQRIDPITKKRGACSRCNGIGIVPTR